jgi:hypothetical protein
MRIDLKSIKQQKALAAALVALALLIGVALLFIEPAERLGFVIFTLLILGLGLANALHPGVRAFVLRLFDGYFRLCFWLGFWLIVITGPLTLFRALSDALLASDSTFLRALVLAIWGLLLLSSAFVVMYGRTGERLLNRMRKIGILAPLVYSLNLLLISIQFFAAATFLLQESGGVNLTLGSAKALSVDAVADFFLWHFLNAVPVLKITDTLLWDPPLTYDQPTVGWILLAFKISVISPVIAAFGWSWKRFRKAPTRTGDSPTETRDNPSSDTWKSSTGSGDPS